MNEIRCVPLSTKKTISKKNNDQERVPEGSSWLQCGQRLQADVKARSQILKLTGALHSEWKKEPASEKGQAFAEAYKASLDVSFSYGLQELAHSFWRVALTSYFNFSTFRFPNTAAKFSCQRNTGKMSKLTCTTYLTLTSSRIILSIYIIYISDS